MKALVVIPTYNERENIGPLISAIFEQKIDVDVLVVDDNSPDGTGRVVHDMALRNSRLFLLSRPGKNGLGKAYLAGFEWGLSRDYEIIVEMDADFSHRPQDLAKLVSELRLDKADFVVGSRYVHGGGTVNWDRMRKLISMGGSFYARRILGFPLRDWTGGFNGWRRKVLEGIGLANIKSEGYSFQVELKFRALQKGFRGIEVPIIFEERRLGQSKMSGRIVIEAMFRVWKMKFSS